MAKRMLAPPRKMRKVREKPGWRKGEEFCPVQVGYKVRARESEKLEHEAGTWKRALASCGGWRGDEYGVGWAMGSPREERSGSQPSGKEVLIPNQNSVLREPTVRG